MEISIASDFTGVEKLLMNFLLLFSKQTITFNVKYYDKLASFRNMKHRPLLVYILPISNQGVSVLQTAIE